MSDSGVVVGGRYRLTRLIGSGGMGRVWLARDEVLHRSVAVKEVVLPPTLTPAERDELCQRMLREARTAGRLNHPNVVAIYDVVEEGDRPWIVLEYVPSRSLYQVIREDGPVPPKRAAEIGLAILGALNAAHAAKVLHRDVKPGNVLLAEDGRVVLTDFGLATFDGDGSITEAGLIMGSAQYIAPERARDGVSTQEADLWSLGATLYAAVEGRSPYARESSMATLTALATDPPDPVRRAGPLLPVLAGLLRKDPRERMRAAEAERLLRQAVAGGPPTRATGRLGRPGRPGRPARPDRAGPAAPVGSGTGPTTADVAGPGEAAARPDAMRMRTATEETLHYSAPRRRWPELVAGLLILVGAGAAIVVWRPWTAVPGGGVAPSSSATAAATGLTAAMGVPACLLQSPSVETPVSPGPTALPGGGYGVINDNFTYYEDEAGFWVQVPVQWRVSRVGSLVCFRDPNAPKAFAVEVVGRVDGHPVELLTRSEPRWRDAAGLIGYERLGLVETFTGEGSGDLEYTYQRDGLVMHGENRLLRLGGVVYIVSCLTTDLYWPTDREMFQILQVSLSLSE
jgi:hypothetical protein